MGQRYALDNNSIKKSIKEKQRLYKSYKFNHSAENEKLYKRYNNQLGTYIRQCEVNYYKDLFNDKKNSIKRLWTNLGHLLNPNKYSNSSGAIDKLLIDGKEIKDNIEIADTLNNYFANIGGNLSGNIPSIKRSFKDYLRNPTPASIFLRPMNLVKVGREIDRLKNKISTLNKLKIDVIKFVKNKIIEGLTIIINLSILEGKVPDLLKVAKIIPVYKNDDNCSPSNYRPISLLSIFDKILEKTIYLRLKQFLEKHNILYKYQLGFRENHSTSHALTDLVEYIYK